MKTGLIYKLYFTNNSYFIYGSTFCLKKRKYAYFHKLIKNLYNNDILQKVYNKYDGKNTIRWEIVQDNIPEKILEFVEDIWIGSKCARSEDKNKGMNMRDASRTRFSKETIDKIVKANKGRIPHNKGKKHSEETKEKIKQKRKLQIISHSQETKDKIGKSHKGKKLTKEHIEKLCEKIVQLDLNNNYIKTWNSAREASTILNIHSINISSIITNNKISAILFKCVKEKIYNNE